VREFWWLYRSWLLSGAWHTSALVAFVHPEADRRRLPADVNLTYVPLAPLANRDPAWADYRFVNSVWFPTAPEADFLRGFDFVLRTDGDCFLTPQFCGLRPRCATFGVGAFADRYDVARRLVDLAERWQVPHVMNNVGSTVLAHGEMLRLYSQVQLDYCRRLRDEEFRDGPGEWPGWWRGVMSMYAGQLAANAVFGRNMHVGGLDVYCGQPARIGPGDYHIHAWHTYEDFSKFKWRRGEYAKVDPHTIDPGTVSGYCLWCAGARP